MIKFKENSTVAKYSGELQEYEYLVDGNDILIKFEDIYI
jgi:hypothetical protein